MIKKYAKQILHGTLLVKPFLFRQQRVKARIERELLAKMAKMELSKGFETAFKNNQVSFDIKVREPVFFHGKGKALNLDF